MHTLRLSSTRIGPRDTTRHGRYDMTTKAALSIRHWSIGVVVLICFLWLPVAAIAAEVEKPMIDMHSDQATVPVWVFVTTLIAAIGTTAAATWHIAMAVARFEHKLDQIQRAQRDDQGERRE